jgi:hypothetical protein
VPAKFAVAFLLRPASTHINHPANHNMRPLRLLLALSTSLAAVTLVLYVALASQQDQYLGPSSHTRTQGGFKALLSFTSPGSLFPPSAIISLTDDNSTFFLARPAAFGPTLPKDGLSSALWIGSGFGDDTLGKGELGCGDSSDWHGHDHRAMHAPEPTPIGNRQQSPIEGKTNSASTVTDTDASRSSSAHARLDTPKSEPTALSPSKNTYTHADIKSLQESAEIDGKVVLLKRGGCGFSAKVLWAQNRGAVAVIVGDNVRGGGLIRMYAQGDTSNFTIPSVFTSHTTAHLLSSLLPGRIVGGLLSGNGPNADHGAPSHGSAPMAKQENVPASKVPSISSLGPSVSLPSLKLGKSKAQSSPDEPAKNVQQDESRGYAILAALHSGIPHDPLTLGDFAEMPPVSSPLSSNSAKEDQSIATPASSSLATAGSEIKYSQSGPNVLPGTGGYQHKTMTDSERKAWWAKWFSVIHDAEGSPKAKSSRSRSITSITDANSDDIETSTEHSLPHEGLWVTLTPTNVSASPFFDTLLVLVVSPLVTLSVVYALLLLRSRIRRRRWRAPKSLVERLPVRTYQTISDSTSSATPSAASPTTPLLQHSPSQPVPPLHSRQSLNEEGRATSSTADVADRAREEEKRATGLAEWRRRYGGRQKECVVCLEEYEDGISRVMSLPCGHEFHADCM